MTPRKSKDTFAEQALLPDNARAAVARATTREQLLLLAARLGVGVTIVAGHHGHATGHWNIGGSLRGKITDADIGTLEKNIHQWTIRALHAATTLPDFAHRMTGWGCPAPTPFSPNRPASAA